jgi:hypothetical protein
LGEKGKIPGGEGEGPGRKKIDHEPGCACTAVFEDIKRKFTESISS